MKSHFFIFLFCLVCICACSNKSKPETRFVFIGDIHYMISDNRTAGYLIPSFVRELDSLALNPEFIIQTGDFFHGGKGADRESEFAFKDFSEKAGIPFFISKGNHDVRIHYEKNAFPIFSRELKTSINKSYYSFNKSNCHFIILDCTDEKLGDQLSWLEKDLENANSNPAIDHIFVAGHYPLWIVARAGFTRPEYADPVASLLARYSVDAYFCGHTHNKTATVRLINGQPLTQIMDAGVVEENRMFNLAPFLKQINNRPYDLNRPGGLPLERGHQIFIPDSELRYYWGYQEGSTASYYLIKVNGRSVQADWHVLGQGTVRSFKWDKPGEIVEIKAPVKEDKNTVTIACLRQIEKAWLYAAPWTDNDSVCAPFRINGIPSGNLEISRKKMAGSPFWNKIEVPLGRPAIEAIRKENEIEISNPLKERFGVAHILLLVKFIDGSFALSNPSPRVLTSFHITGGEFSNFPEPSQIESVNIGEPLGRAVLKFDKIY